MTFSTTSLCDSLPDLRRPTHLDEQELHHSRPRTPKALLPPCTKAPTSTIPRALAKARYKSDFFCSSTPEDSSEGSDEDSEETPPESPVEEVRQKVDVTKMAPPARPSMVSAKATQQPSSGYITSDYAFAFDIDGVLLRGGNVIPEAKKALRILNGENKDGIKVPFIFLTNGGGKTEEERCIDLSKQLEAPISPQQFICGHTPMREMALKYGTVLVVGGEGEKCRHVAEGYGFRDVVTPGDLIKWKPAVSPFRRLTEEEYFNSRERDFSKVEIEAIFVFADSRDWAGDAQIILELLMSKKGRMGTLSETFTEGPPIFFSHNDVVWSTSYELTRYGMGALRVMIEALYEKSTGKKLNPTAFGKPQMGTFRFATKVLTQWRKDVFGISGPPKTVYFIGDTPESDIRGTNEFNKISKEDWYSILVETGVYEAGSKPAYRPRKTVKNVLEAVEHGMMRSAATKQFPTIETISLSK